MKTSSSLNTPQMSAVRSQLASQEASMLDGALAELQHRRELERMMSERAAEAHRQQQLIQAARDAEREMIQHLAEEAATQRRAEHELAVATADQDDLSNEAHRAIGALPPKTSRGSLMSSTRSVRSVAEKQSAKRELEDLIEATFDKEAQVRDAALVGYSAPGTGDREVYLESRAPAASDRINRALMAGGGGAALGALGGAAATLLGRGRSGTRNALMGALGGGGLGALAGAAAPMSVRTAYDPDYGTQLSEREERRAAAVHRALQAGAQPSNIAMQQPGTMIPAGPFGGQAPTFSYAADIDDMVREDPAMAQALMGSSRGVVGLGGSSTNFDPRRADQPRARYGDSMPIGGDSFGNQFLQNAQGGVDFYDHETGDIIPLADDRAAFDAQIKMSEDGEKTEAYDDAPGLKGKQRTELPDALQKAISKKKDSRLAADLEVARAKYVRREARARGRFANRAAKAHLKNAKAARRAKKRLARDLTRADDRYKSSSIYGINRSMAGPDGTTLRLMTDTARHPRADERELLFRDAINRLEDAQSYYGVDSDDYLDTLERAQSDLALVKDIDDYMPEGELTSTRARTPEEYARAVQELYEANRRANTVAGGILGGFTGGTAGLILPGLVPDRGRIGRAVGRNPILAPLLSLAGGTALGSLLGRAATNKSPAADKTVTRTLYSGPPKDVIGYTEQNYPALLGGMKTSGKCSPATRTRGGVKSAYAKAKRDGKKKDADRKNSPHGHRREE